jgi:hypothetical protein
VLDEAAKGRDLRKLVPVSLDGTEPPKSSASFAASGPRPARRHANRPRSQKRSTVHLRFPAVAYCMHLPARRLRALPAFSHGDKA